MSQAKVDRYKEEKANRKKIMAKEKLQRRLTGACAGLVALAIVGWAGVSYYQYYESQQPAKTIYCNVDAIDEYMEAINE